MATSEFFEQVKALAQQHGLVLEDRGEDWEPGDGGRYVLMFGQQVVQEADELVELLKPNLGPGDEMLVTMFPTLLTSSTFHG
ncbi:MAG: hypothetical protein GDA50_07405 [Alphaproteobacteria bacterium GM202ARS2]|nr:hypothetical protein [Alphaproteobacteria bacterium GM202ARS2]